MSSDSLDHVMSEFTEEDIKIMSAIVNRHYKSGLKFSAKANVDISPLGGTISSSLKQLRNVSKKVSKIRLDARKRAIEILKKNIAVVNFQLKFIKDQNSDLRRELGDVKKELNSCYNPKDEASVMTPAAKNIAIESAMKQVSQVYDESSQIDSLIDETLKESEKAEKEASSSVLKGEKGALEELDDAIEDQKDIQKIQTEMEKAGDIPKSISAIPKAPIAPGQEGYIKPQIWKTSDGEKIKITPEQAAGADEIQEELVEEKKDLLSALRDAIGKRRESIDPVDSESNIMKTIMEIRSRAGYPLKKNDTLKKKIYKIGTNNKNNYYKSRPIGAKKYSSSLMSSLNDTEEFDSSLKKEEEERFDFSSCDIKEEERFDFSSSDIKDKQNEIGEESEGVEDGDYFYDDSDDETF